MAAASLVSRSVSKAFSSNGFVDDDDDDDDSSAEVNNSVGRRERGEEFEDMMLLPRHDLSCGEKALASECCLEMVMQTKTRTRLRAIDWLRQRDPFGANRVMVGRCGVDGFWILKECEERRDY